MKDEQLFQMKSKAVLDYRQKLKLLNFCFPMRLQSQYREQWGENLRRITAALCSTFLRWEEWKHWILYRVLFVGLCNRIRIYEFFFFSLTEENEWADKMLTFELTSKTNSYQNCDYILHIVFELFPILLRSR